MRTTGVAPCIDRDTQQGVKSCNCKKSNCLKLYCDCFASSSYCSPQRCNCTACFNNLESEHSRRVAVISTIERNPNAFRSKILSSSNVAFTSVNQSVAEVALHHKGCHCKKSNCLKKYCECFQLGIVCSDRCRCNNCKNFPGSVERNKCLTVGIKEISQIIRKSEIGTTVAETDTIATSSSSASSSSSLSSSSSSYSSAPSSISDEFSLVRRLDDLGSILSHDVISKVCQTMLQTVFEESKNTGLIGKRRRTSSVPPESAHGCNSPLKKVKIEKNIHTANENIASLKSTNNGVPPVSSNNVNELPLPLDSGIAGEDDGIVSKLLRAFGKSVLGAVQSLASHNEIDMSLGIAGLHSLKMERDRERLSDAVKPEITPFRAGITSASITGTRSHLKLGSKATHPFSQSGPSALSPLLRSDSPSIFATSPLNREEFGDDYEYEVPSTLKLCQGSRSLSINSATTTEDRWSQDPPEDYHETEYKQNKEESNSDIQSVLKYENKSEIEFDNSPYHSKVLSFRESITDSLIQSTGNTNLEFHDFDVFSSSASVMEDVMNNVLSALDDKIAEGADVRVLKQTGSCNAQMSPLKNIYSDAIVESGVHDDVG